MEEKKTYGKLTIGVGTHLQRDTEIVDYLKASFKDSRFIMIGEVSEGGHLLMVENLPSTGRQPQQTMWLSEESLMGIVTTTFLYFNAKGIDMKELLNMAVPREGLIDYTFSPNLRKTDFDVDKS